MTGVSVYPLLPALDDVHISSNHLGVIVTPHSVNLSRFTKLLRHQQRSIRTYFHGNCHIVCKLYHTKYQDYCLFTSKFSISVLPPPHQTQLND